MHAEEIIPTFSTSNIYIVLCLPKALTLARLRWYKLFRNNTRVGLRGILGFPLRRDRVSAKAGERDSSQGESSVASTIPGQNSTPLSSLNYSGVADIAQHVAVTQSAAQRQSMITPTAMPGTISCHTPAPGEPSQTDSTRPVVCSLASGIASTPTPLRSLDNMPTPISNPEAHATITNAMRTRATESNRRKRQWELQPQAVSTPQSLVSGGRSIH